MVESRQSSEYEFPPMSVTGTDSDSAPPTLDMRDNEDGNDSNAEGSSLYQPSLAQHSQEGFGNSGSSFDDVTATTVGEKVSECYGPQPYAHLASICQSIRVCVSPIPVLFEPATFVYLFS
jgi:hypothetical protein